MIYGDPEVMRGLSGKPVADLEEQRERLAAVLGRYAGTPYGMWALETREGGLVGSVLLKPLPESEKIEVGWHLGRAHWGQGYATEAGRGAIEHGFSALGLQTIYAVAFGWNEPSLAVMRRLGMQRLGTTDEFYGHELELYCTVREMF